MLVLGKPLNKNFYEKIFKILTVLMKYLESYEYYENNLQKNNRDPLIIKHLG